MNCPKCSAYTEDSNASFCCVCGSALQENKSTSANTTTSSNTFTNLNKTPSGSTPSRTSNKNNTLIICIAAVVVVTLICVTAISVAFISRPKTADYTTEVSQNSQNEDSEGQNQTADDATSQENTTKRHFEAEEAQTAVTVYVPMDEYLFPTHNTYLTYEILSYYTEEEIDLICNEMYARHGQIFKKQKNINYFSRQNWYVGKYTSMDYVVTLFNSYEKANLRTISNYRKYMGWD